MIFMRRICNVLMCIINLLSDMQCFDVHFHLHFQLVLIDSYLVQSACVDQAVVCQSDHVAVVPAHTVFVSAFVSTRLFEMGREVSWLAEAELKGSSTVKMGEKQ